MSMRVESVPEILDQDAISPFSGTITLSNEHDEIRFIGVSAPLPDTIHLQLSRAQYLAVLRTMTLMKAEPRSCDDWGDQCEED